MRSVVRVHCDPHHSFLEWLLHLDNCTKNDERSGQLRNGVIGEGLEGTEREQPEREAKGRGEPDSKHTTMNRENNWSQDQATKKIKLLRAQGGCPGTIRRRKTWQAAKSYGEPQAGTDP